MTGTIKLTLKSKIVSYRRFRCISDVKKHIAYWKELYELKGKSYELTIVPDSISENKSIYSYASFINQKHYRTCQKAKRKSISALAATEGISKVTEPPNYSELRAETTAI